MGDMNVYQMEEKVSLLYENLKMLDDEEICWKQRSHENQLLKGDDNNEFFHRIANGRKRKKLYYVFLKRMGEELKGGGGIS